MLVVAVDAVVAAVVVVVVVVVATLLSLECEMDLEFLRFALSLNYDVSILSLIHSTEPKLQSDL